MQIEILLKIAGVGLLVTAICQVLTRAGREEIATLATVAGILLVAISLCVDTGAYLERTLARDLLAGTEWQPKASFTIHFTLIFFGLAVIFISQIFRIGREMQEEQDLTV